MNKELIRIENVSVGQFDERNFYVATVRVAGEEAKEPGRECLTAMTFYPTLQEALRKSVERVIRNESVSTLHEWASVIETKSKEGARIIEAAANRLANALL